MLEEIAEVLGLHMARQDKASRLVQCARCVENDGPKSSAVSRNHDVDGGRHVCRSQKALEPYMIFPADDRNPHRCAIRADPEAGLRGHLERGYREARRERARLDMHCIRISRSGGRAERRNRAAKRHGCAIAQMASRVGRP